MGETALRGALAVYAPAAVQAPSSQHGARADLKATITRACLDSARVYRGQAWVLASLAGRMLFAMPAPSLAADGKLHRPSLAR
eukprot:15485327-Alexandrium_andersonii.AAC.1